jgi:hypothetical protein
MFFGTALLILGVAGFANAEKFTMTDCKIEYCDKDPGLLLDVQDMMTMPKSWDMAEGEETGWEYLCKIGTTESTVNKDDKQEMVIKATFHFSDPSNSGYQVTGESYGKSYFRRAIGIGYVEWNSPAQCDFGGDGYFNIHLTDLKFGTPGSDWCKMKISYDCAPTPSVPEPGVTLLLGSAMLGLFGFRKNSINRRFCPFRNESGTEVPLSFFSFPYALQ